MPVRNMSHPIGLIRRFGLECRGVIMLGLATARRLTATAVLDSKVLCISSRSRRCSEYSTSEFLRISAITPSWHCVRSQVGDEVDFHVASNAGQSSSIFEFGTHAQRH